ncbi:MAG: hypothetical protein LBT14_11770 [Treponema sp.]|jgi:hypothetical protein|nr:hypothetical protein [Treponema sp.]
MLVTEWNWDTALKVSKKDGWVEGVDQVLELIRQGITSEAEIRRHLDLSNQSLSGSTLPLTVHGESMSSG